MIPASSISPVGTSVSKSSVRNPNTPPTLLDSNGDDVSHQEGLRVAKAYAVERTHSSDYIIRSGFAGGLAGCAAKSIIAPLDRVKILFQTSSPEFAKYSGTRMGVWRAASQIYSQDGVLGLYQGHSATLLRIFPYAAIKFVVYEQIRSVLISRPDQETNVRRVLSGSLAGVTSVFFTYPLELIRVRLAYQTRKDQRASFVRICKQIFNEGRSVSDGHEIPNVRGMHNFYRGFTPTLLGMLPYAGVSFWTHDTIHDIFRSKLLAPYAVADGSASSDRHVPLTVWAQLMAGGMAGMVAQTASYPLEVVRRRMQVGGTMKEKEFRSIWATARVIWLQRGFKGFFVGLTIGYIKVIPMVSCSFFVYERMKILLGI
ncbi:mitochondrial carrier domain-containing protein [Lipomyces tetrasporus]|uniref:Mitochondrial carrier domain-containing protein n=1 Tax=Lipomyces tetrasporus TaxID=54092 RepID=A0AAD7VPS0_9ASCO|nr:mitochondrial carrier domain-containing protein [Lipomyces tetrasporus]KAJ8097478.1 mitochondrial carrier domain-containing protein [Lipomyces tetrasporus]